LYGDGSYSQILNPKADSELGDMACLALSKFRKMRNEQIRPILLTLMHQKSLENISNSEFDDIIVFIMRFLFSYVIIGRERTNNLQDTIYRHASILEKDFTKDNLNKFLENLKSKIPNKEWFNSLFQNVGYSRNGLNNDRKQKETAQIVLELHEQYLSKLNEIGDFTIEHILPDSESDNNSRIGNLLPLEEGLNKQCGDKTLAEKMAIYEKSRFQVVQCFVKRYKDAPKTFDIKKRTEHMATLFYKEILKLPMA